MMADKLLKNILDWSNEQNFQNLNNPAEWCDQAERLIRAARHIELVHRIFLVEMEKAAAETSAVLIQPIPYKNTAELMSAQSVYPLLIGYAAETILKGLLISNTANRIERDRKNSHKMKYPWAGNGHDLKLLAKQAGVSLSSADEYHLAALTTFTTWKSRYPAPSNLEGQIANLMIGLNFREVHTTVTNLFFKLLDAIQRNPYSTPDTLDLFPNSRAEELRRHLV